MGSRCRGLKVLGALSGAERVLGVARMGMILRQRQSLQLLRGIASASAKELDMAPDEKTELVN